MITAQREYRVMNYFSTFFESDAHNKSELVYAFILTIIPSEKGIIYFEARKFQASLNNLYFPRFVDES